MTQPETRSCSQRQTGNAAAATQPAVLVVEDSKAEQLRLQAILQQFGYPVRLADDAEQALDVLRKEEIQFVISDWRMPGMSGIELCRHLRTNGNFGQPYVILVTGQSAKSDLVVGMEAGADDFIAKPFNSEELRVRLQAGVRLLRLREEADRRNAELTEAHRIIQADLSAAAQMQQSLLPPGGNPMPGVEVASLFLPASVVAGDSFNYFALDDRHLAFYQIDVSGHGIASAMLSFTVSRFFTPEIGAICLRHAPQGNQGASSPGIPGYIVPPHEVVAALNQRFLEKGDCTHYFTMVYGVLDVNTGSGQLCQAGHPHPLICDQQGNINKLGAGGFPVGMLDQASYESVPFHLAPGERLVLYSDGITECRAAADDREFGSQRLQALLAREQSAGLAESIEQLRRELLNWHGERPQDDDVSLIALARTGDEHGH